MEQVHASKLPKLYQRTASRGVKRNRKRNQNRKPYRQTFRSNNVSSQKKRSRRPQQPTVRFLESSFPSISNALLTVASTWWNALAVEECVRSPPPRAFSGSNRT